MNWFHLTISVLAVWRITHLFQAEDGPWGLVFKIRALAGKGFLGSLMDCFYCLSIWVALPFGYCMGDSWLYRFMLWMAYSAGAILLNDIFEKKED